MNYLTSNCEMKCVIVQCRWFFFNHTYLTVYLYMQKAAQELLFIMTARFHVAVLSFDRDKRDIVTRAYGDVKVRVRG